MESPDVFTQDELDAALQAGEVVPVCAGDGEFSVDGTAIVHAADAARVTATGRAFVDAGGEAVVRADDAATVLALERVTVSAGGSASVRAGGESLVRVRDSASVVAATRATIEAWDAARITARANTNVTARDRCSVRAYGAASVLAVDDTTVQAWGRALVELRGRAKVRAWGAATVRTSGEATVEALEQCMVEAGGRSRVRAYGATIVRARGQSTVEAAERVTVTSHGQGPTISGGVLNYAPSPLNALEWCEHYGVEVHDGVVTLYKAVGDDYDSYYGMSYKPGSTPRAPDWDGGEQECGGGIHLSPYPGLAQQRTYGATRFIACPVRVDDLVVHPRGAYPDKVKAPGVCAPVYEVDEHGRPI